MKLAAEEWRSLSQLLDEALSLPQGERMAWVENLAAQHAALRPLLAELFARPASASTADLVGTLPSASPASPIAADSSSSPELRALRDSSG